MKKIDQTVIKETIYIATFCGILSLLMQSVFLIIGKWDYTVLLGNIYGLAISVGNFFLLGITVQKSLEKETDDAKKQLKLSQSLRLLMMFVAAIVGYLLPCFNLYAMLIPYLFPRIAISFRPKFNKE